MGFIKRPVEIVGLRKAKVLTALFDSGAYRNYIRRALMDGETAEGIGFHVFEGPHRAMLADGSQALGERVRFKELRIEGRAAKEPSFVVMDDLFEEAIIGAELMQALGISLDPPRERIVLT